MGRQSLLTRVDDLWSATRLVTLIGPGGVGKTRLAQEVRARTDDSAWVDLAALTDPLTVPHAVAEAAGLTVTPGTPLAGTLRRWAAESRCLVVLDNCEHLLDAVAELLADLLEAPQGVRILATSRERVGVPGERVLPVPPLAVPAPGQCDPRVPAVQLFLSRAAEADADFQPDEALVERIGAVCRALDGLPLAIELAAARVGGLTVDDLAERLHSRFELLIAAGRGREPRHQTLRAVIDWSHQLLSEPERRLFARLHVFAAGFDIAAVEAVATDGDLTVEQAAHLVARLADQSMLTRPGHAGVGRYRMLDSLRSYAAEQLPVDEVDQLRRRHAGYLVEVAERAGAALLGRDEKECAELLDSWLDDFRAAWAWTRDVGEMDLAVRLVAALTPYAYWRLRIDLLSWGDWVAENVTAHPRLPTALAAAAHAAWMRGHPDTGRELARRGIDVAGGDTAPAAIAPLEAYGDVGLMTGDLAAALWAYRALTRLTVPATAVHAMGLANEALALAYADDPAAWPTARQAVVQARASGNPSAIALTRYSEGEAAADQDPAAALDAFDEARRVSADVGSRFANAIALTAMVALRGRHGPPDEAFALYRDTIGQWYVAGNRAILATALRNLVVLLARTGHDREAVELAATMQHAAPTPSYGAEAGRIDTALAAARRRLPPPEYATAWTRGGQRQLEEAAVLAQQLLTVAAGTTRRQPHDSAR